jgi:glycosyltransferase involved in cell wall biosynthesis
MNKKFDLTVILPALNESKTIKKIIKNININLETKIFYQILVSDNYSDDNTVAIVKNLKNVKVTSVKERGYGLNLRSAIKKINSKYAIFFDPDGSYDASHILLMYDKIRKENLDLVYLNRLQKQEKGSMPFLNKYLGTPVLTFFINFLHGKKCVGREGGGEVLKKESLIIE